MKTRHYLTACAVLALVMGILLLSACSETQQAQYGAHFSDRPASILCTSYDRELVNTRTMGRIEFDETGRIQFVDAKTGKLVITEGECVVEYDR